MVHRIGRPMFFQGINDTQIVIFSLRQVLFALINSIFNSLIIHNYFDLKTQLKQYKVNIPIHHADDRKQNRRKFSIEEQKIDEHKVIGSNFNENFKNRLKYLIISNNFNFATATNYPTTLSGTP